MTFLEKEYFQAREEGRVVCGVFRTSTGEVFSAHWEREFPGCFVAGQGGTVWSFTPASEQLALVAGL